MVMKKVYYTIEKHHGLYTIWKNIEDHGMGCFGIYTSELKKDCIEYAKEHNLKIRSRRSKRK